MKRLRYAERIKFCINPLAKRLLQCMENKKSNLALAADVMRGEELLALAEQLGPEICVFKTHIDIIEDFTPALTTELIKLAQKHDFFIFEDRKFADIGNTVQAQYAKGIYQIAEWADLINAHSLPGPGIVAGLAAVGAAKQRGLLLLAEMSSANNLLHADYAQKTVQMAEQFPEFVIGFIAQHKLTPHPGWLYLTPGVQFAATQDQLGQQYVTPEQALLKNHVDIIIVGRGILTAEDPLVATKKYRAAAWHAYELSCGEG